MEEAQYRLNRLRDEMDYYLVVTPSAEFETAELEILRAPAGDLERCEPAADRVPKA
jgi:hypothetical protein